jgi:hypothetical protein
MHQVRHTLRCRRICNIAEPDGMKGCYVAHRLPAHLRRDLKAISAIQTAPQNLGDSLGPVRVG